MDKRLVVDPVGGCRQRHVHLNSINVLQMPEKDESYISDFERVVESITLQDIHLLLRTLGIRRESMWEAVGVSGPVPPSSFSRPSKEILEIPINPRSSTRLGASKIKGEQTPESERAFLQASKVSTTC